MMDTCTHIVSNPMYRHNSYESEYCTVPDSTTTGPGVPKLALLCIDETSTERFREDLIQQYRYELLGGLHSVEARKKLLEDYPGNDNHLSSDRKSCYT